MISTNFSYSRFRNIVNDLKLNLSEKTILTEASTGAYVVTPVIAAYAGAKVHMFAKDSSYGKAEEAYKQVFSLATELGCEKNIQIFDSGGLQKFDIITNSGHLRPINKSVLSKLSENGVVLLMYEEWELRKSDIDLDYCQKNNIRVVATNERHQLVDVFGFLGDMAVKLILDYRVPIYRSNILLLNNNFFGLYIAKTLSGMCEKLYVIGDNKDEYSEKNMNWICNFNEFQYNHSKLPDSIDHILYTAYPFQEILLGDKSKPIDATILKNKYPDVNLFRYCGDIDSSYCDSIGLKYYPAQVKSGHMGIIPSEIGFEPVIRLQAGSLKAGELALKDDSFFESNQVAVNINLTQFV
jgi:hypothetical protein